jgi:hypothetical protein
MFSTTILTSWAGCPQSRLYQEVVASGDRALARKLTLVARQWDHTLTPRWFIRALPRRVCPGRFEPADYGDVLAHVSTAALAETLDHVAWLRAQPRVRGSLRSVAFLEEFEAAVAHEADTRENRNEFVLLWAPAEAVGDEAPVEPPRGG